MFIGLIIYCRPKDSQNQIAFFFRCHLADTLNNDVKIDEDLQIVYIHIQNTQRRNNVILS